MFRSIMREVKVERTKEQRFTVAPKGYCCVKRCIHCRKNHQQPCSEDSQAGMCPFPREGRDGYGCCGVESDLDIADGGDACTCQPEHACCKEGIEAAHISLPVEEDGDLPAVAAAMPSVCVMDT